MVFLAAASVSLTLSLASLFSGANPLGTIDPAKVLSRRGDWLWHSWAGKLTCLPAWFAEAPVDSYALDGEPLRGRVQDYGKFALH